MYYGGDNYKRFLEGEEGFDLEFIKKLNQNLGFVQDSDCDSEDWNLTLLQ